MGELLAGLFALAVVLVILAAVGHGIWLLGAALFRALSGAAPPTLPELCPRCRTALRPNATCCGACGHVLDSAQTEPLSELSAIERQINRWHRSAELDHEQWRHLQDLVRQERQKLQEPVVRADQPFPSTEPAAPPPLPKRKSAVPTQHVNGPVAPTVATVATSDDESVEFEIVSSAEEPPVRPLGNVLQAFMEEKNIRWGELVSGMLIVGSAIGLVISLWATLKQAIPYFPALLFLLVTAGLHAAGLYTLKRWKLRSTSRGLLIISTLLVPLNFLAGIAVSDERPTYDPLYMIAVATGLLVFSAISISAARVLLRRRWLPLAIGIMGPCVGQLVISRYAVPASTRGDLTYLAIIPFASFLIAMANPLRRLSLGSHLTLRRVGQTLLLLGASLFGLAVPVGLLVWKTGELGATLAMLSPWLSAAAGIALCAGLIVHRRLVSPVLATTRTAGTAVAVASAIGMIAPVVLAWPQPDLLLAVGLVNFVVLTGLAFAGRMPVLHLPATAAAAFACLVAFHLVQGRLTFDPGPSGRQLVEVLVMGRSGVVLLVLAGVASLAGGLLQWLGRKADAFGYLCGASMIGIGSISIAVYSGFVSGVDGDLATLVLAACAAAVLPVAAQTGRSSAGWLGSGLLLVSLVHALGWNLSIQAELAQLGVMPARPLVVAILLHATVITLLAMSAVAWTRLRDKDALPADPRDGFLSSLTYSALLSTVLALPVVVTGFGMDLVAAHARYAGWMAAVWLCIAFVGRSGWLVAASQVLGTFAVMLGATAVARHLSWWSGDLLAAEHVQMQLGALAVWSAIWPAVRLASRSVPSIQQLLAPFGLTVDRIVFAGVVVSLLSVSLVDCLPGVSAEFRASGIVPVDRQATWLILAVFSTLAVGLVASLQWAEGRNPALGVVGLSFIGLATFVLPMPRGPLGSLDGPLFIDGVGCWIVVMLAMAGLLVALRERVTLDKLSALMIVGASATLLIAALFQAETAVASALRWSLATYGLLLAAVLSGRERITTWTGRMGFQSEGGDTSSPYTDLRAVAIGLTLLPLLALSLRPLVELAGGSLVAGPEAGSLFASIGTGWSYAFPCWLLTLALIAFAVRDRCGSYALAGSLLTQLGLSLAVLLPDWIAGEAVGATHLVLVLQCIAIGFGVYATAWIAVARRFDPEGSAQKPRLDSPPTAIGIHQSLALGMLALLSLWATSVIFISPGDLPQHLGALGSWIGFAAVVVVAASWAYYSGFQRAESIVAATGCAAIVSVPLIAAAFAGASTEADWLSYHVLSGGWCTVAVSGAVFIATAVLLRGNLAEESSPRSDHAAELASQRHIAVHWSDPATFWVFIAAALVVLLAIRGEWHDPGRPWWSGWTTFFVASAVATLGVRRRSQRLAYWSMLLLMLSAALVWMRPWIGFAPLQTVQDGVHLLQAILVAASLAGFFWLLVTLYFQRGIDQELDPTFTGPPLHHSTAIGALLIAAVLTAGCLALRTLAITFGGNIPIDISNPGGWLLVGSLTLLVSVSVWDRTARHAVGALYLLGLVAMGIDLDGLELEPDYLLFAAGLAATGYVLATGLVWTQRGRILEFAERMEMPQSTLDPVRIGSWLPTANVVLACFGVVVEFWVALTFDDWRFRVAAAIGVAFAVPGFAALAQEDRRERMQYLSLMSAVIAAVCFGWATMPISGEPDYWLQRAVRLMVMLSASASVYGIVLVRVLPSATAWFRSTWRATVSTGAAALLSLLAVLVLEGVWYDPEVGAPVTGLQIAVVAIVLVGLSGALVSLALLPESDPLKLSERGRMWYVYAAEAVLSLLFLHVRLTMPELFRGYLLPYWPFIVMAIAFCGVGLGELLQRRRVLVLAEPLQRTGAFLPLLPAIGFWVHMSQSDNPLIGDYSTLLFLGGLLYVALSMWRKSFVYSLAAAVAGNGGLWALLSEQDLTLLARPQMWLIPPAVSVLVAAQINRRRLDAAQLTTIRYLAITVIYASSTAEMFITGVGESLWLPIVLATLSVGGVLAGIALKVRAFLYLGSSFLLLSIISMVWHAARNIGHVWPWWAFGIALGLAILTLFGLFEKKRSEMEELVAGLRQWDR